MSVVETIHERRRAPRAEVDFATVVSETRPKSLYPGMEETLFPLFGRVLNLSVTGVLVEAEELVPPGRKVDVILELDGRRLRLRGRVARICRPRAADHVRLGIQFDRLGAEERGLIEAFLDARRPRPHLN